MIRGEPLGQSISRTAGACTFRLNWQPMRPGTLVVYRGEALLGSDVHGNGALQRAWNGETFGTLDYSQGYVTLPVDDIPDDPISLVVDYGIEDSVLTDGSAPNVLPQMPW